MDIRRKLLCLTIKYSNVQAQKSDSKKWNEAQRTNHSNQMCVMRICFICNGIFHSQFYSNVSSHANKIRALFDFDVIMFGIEQASYVHAHILMARLMLLNDALCFDTDTSSSTSSSGSTNSPGNLKTVMRLFYSCIKISSVVHSNKIYCTLFFVQPILFFANLLFRRFIPL